jgi:hypothetical protein
MKLRASPIKMRSDCGGTKAVGSPQLLMDWDRVHLVILEVEQHAKWLAKW